MFLFQLLYSSIHENRTTEANREDPGVTISPIDCLGPTVASMVIHHSSINSLPAVTPCDELAVVPVSLSIK